MLGWSSWWHPLIAFVAAFAAGAVNAVAGGGTLIAFPTLLWLGLPAVRANATNAVALWPGSLGATWGFRDEIVKARRWWLWLLAPSLVGGAVGAYLLLTLPSTIFRSVAPYLVLAGAVVLALEKPLEKLLRAGLGKEQPTRRRVVAIAAQLAIAVYGGYFGAGIGILILTALGLLGVEDLDRANGLKNLFTIAVKGAAVIYFVVVGAVVWHAAILMAVGAVVGGYAGAALQHRVGQRITRWLVVGIGMAMAIAMFVRLAA